MIDRDGELVASWSGSGGPDMDLVGAHYEIIFDAAIEAASRHGGQVNSIVISTDSSKIAILALKEGYCLVVALEAGAYEGRALMEAGRAAKEIETEMG